MLGNESIIYFGDGQILFISIVKNNSLIIPSFAILIDSNDLNAKMRFKFRLSSVGRANDC